VESVIVRQVLGFRSQSILKGTHANCGVGRDWNWAGNWVGIVSESQYPAGQVVSISDLAGKTPCRARR